MKKTVVLLAIMLFSLFVPAGSVHAGIFDGFNSGSTGIFGNIGDRVNSIFSGRDVELGGAVIPFNPTPPAPPPPNSPPPPGAGQFLKVTVEWDTFYRGLQPVEIETEDPMRELHEEFITEQGCCADCGEIALKSACDLCAERSLFGPDVCTQCQDPLNSYHAEIEPVLWGWCGGPGYTNGNVVSRTQGEISSPPTDSPGPNDNILQGSIPNKMIRRDGYAFKCLKVACEPVYAPTPTPPWADGTPPEPVLLGYRPAERWNYIEFQTLIYHSNDFIISLKIENVGDTTFEPFMIDDPDTPAVDPSPDRGIRVFRHTRDGKEWPHNIDLGEWALGFDTVAGYMARTHKHGNTLSAQMEKAGSSPLLPGQSSEYMQYSDVAPRTTIPSVPIDFGGGMGLGGARGGNTPRDYNFVCDPDDPQESERCPADMQNYSGEDAYLLLERPLTVEEFQKYFFEFRDVTMMGGCGYNASSNNSVIGPITYEVIYAGPTVGTRASRSVVNFSLPVGNPLDDEAHPFGWPTTGRVAEDWGNTSIAQELGNVRNLLDGRREYDEYLFCPGEGITYPLDGRPRAGDWLHPGIDIEKMFYRAKPPNIYSSHAGWVTFAGSDPRYPDKGMILQLESDLNKDMIPDFTTVYSHLQEGAFQFDTQHESLRFEPMGQAIPFGSENSIYIPRNYLFGVMGDSGSTGDTHLQYEIFYHNDGGPPPMNGQIGNERCFDSPYLQSCRVERELSFFSRYKFRTESVFGPVFVNP